MSIDRNRLTTRRLPFCLRNGHRKTELCRGVLPGLFFRTQFRVA